MIDQEAPIVGSIRGQPSLANIYGFSWNPSAAENALPETSARLLAEVEYEDGRTGYFMVRPRTWYGTARRMVRVWLTSTSGPAVAAFDIATDPGESIQPSSAPPSGLWQQELYAFTTTGAAMVHQFLNPGWATAFLLMGYNAVAGQTSLGVSIIYPDGSMAVPAGDFTPGFPGPFTRVFATFGPGAAVGTIGVAGSGIYGGPAPYGVQSTITGVAGVAGKLVATWSR